MPIAYGSRVVHFARVLRRSPPRTSLIYATMGGMPHITTTTIIAVAFVLLAMGAVIGVGLLIAEHGHATRAVRHARRIAARPFR